LDFAWSIADRTDAVATPHRRRFVATNKSSTVAFRPPATRETDTLLNITNAMPFFVSVQEEICLVIRDQTTENVLELNVVRLGS
jgi:hypothetical protein